MGRQIRRGKYRPRRTDGRYARRGRLCTRRRRKQTTGARRRNIRIINEEKIIRREDRSNNKRKIKVRFHDQEKTRIWTMEGQRKSKEQGII